MIHIASSIKMFRFFWVVKLSGGCLASVTRVTIYCLLSH